MYTKLKTGIVVTSIVFLSACSSDETDRQIDPDPLAWRMCSEGSSLECAELQVPMDYQESQPGEITLGLNRMPALSQPAKGAILVNPGGPDGAGKELIQSLSESNSIPASVRNEFDIVGFDPRGVGDSTPVDCSEFALELEDVYQFDRAAIESLVSQKSQSAQACFDKYGNYLQQLGSLNVTRDMNEIRIAMNQEKLNFIGYSYGTRLAGLYLQTYPESSGAIILDASMSPNSEVMTLTEQALPALQNNLNSMLEQCELFDSDCNTEDVHQQLIGKVNDLIASQNSEELELLGELVLLAIRSPEFGDFLIGPLLTYLESDDTSELEALIVFLGIDEEDFESEDFRTAQTAVLCADDAIRPTVDDLDSAFQRFNTISDLLAEGSIVQAASCAGWPEAIEPLPLITTRNAPTSLVIGGTSDANTPLRWSEEMAASIGGFLLVSEHRGHTGVFNDESDCLDAIAESFILNNQLPDTDRCEADPD